MKRFIIFVACIVALTLLAQYRVNKITTNTTAGAEAYIQSLVVSPTNGVTAAQSTNIAAYQAKLATNSVVLKFGTDADATKVKQPTSLLLSPQLYFVQSDGANIYQIDSAKATIGLVNANITNQWINDASAVALDVVSTNAPSGTNTALLNGTNTWSAPQTFNGGISIPGTMSVGTVTATNIVGDGGGLTNIQEAVYVTTATLTNAINTSGSISAFQDIGTDGLFLGNGHYISDLNASNFVAGETLAPLDGVNVTNVTAKFVSGTLSNSISGNAATASYVSGTLSNAVQNVASNYLSAVTTTNLNMTGTGTNIIGATVFTNGVTISGTGTNIFGTSTFTNGVYANNLTLTTPVWMDFVTHPTVLSKGGTATTRELLTLTSVITCDGWKVGSYGDGEGQFNHDLTVTNAGFGNIYIAPHVHLSVTNIPANTSNATFAVFYNWSLIGGTFTNAVEGAITNTMTFTTPFKHELLNIGYVTNNLASGTLSSIFSYRLIRYAAATGDVGDSDGITRIHDFDIHYPANRLGSSGPATY